MTASQGDGAASGAGLSTRRGPGTWLALWVSDLRLGVRLAIGGGRTSKTGVARLVLGTIGIGIAVAVLLVGASAGPMFHARNIRDAAQRPNFQPVPGVAPLLIASANTAFRDRSISGSFVWATGPNSPRPPGVSRVPGDGEIVVSQALADLLASDGGALLRPRFPQRVVGIIGRDGVTDSNTLMYYAGDRTLADATRLRSSVGDGTYIENVTVGVYGFGYGGPGPDMPAMLVVLIVIGTVVLLVPVFVFVATSARIAGAERDRRLSAMRLVGADSRQARRIAAAESLVGAGTGLAFGIGLFLLFRALVDNFPILGVRPYPGDVAPPWPLVALIVVLVPGIALVTAQAALRRTIIEPLWVVRRSRPSRRRLWWRLIPLVAGPILMFSQGNVSSSTRDWVTVVVIGAAMLLLGIPALLPWLLERAVARARGGSPAVQLAMRRLQADSGTPARVVGGVAVVLAGAIALQTVLTVAIDRYSGVYSRLPDNPTMLISLPGDRADAVAAKVRALPGVDGIPAVRSYSLRAADGDHFSMSVLTCADLERYTAVRNCVDGQAFRFPGSEQAHDGQTVTVLDDQDPRGRHGNEVDAGTLTVPATYRELTLGPTYASYVMGSIVLTPGAVRGVRLPGGQAYLGVMTSGDRPDLVEEVRNVVAVAGGHQAYVDTRDTVQWRSQTLELFLTIRNGLLGGAVFTLLLAGVSMLVLALEQIRERRRPFAALAAAGVPTRTLARSLLWQNAVPVLIAILVAAATGIGLAMLVFRLVGERFAMAWDIVGLFSGIALVLVLSVTALTLPTLRGATRLTALRME